MIKDECSFMRAHLLRRVVSFTWDVEYGKLRICAVDDGCAPRYQRGESIYSRCILVVRLEIPDRGKGDPLPLRLWSGDHVDGEFLPRERLWPICGTLLTSFYNLFYSWAALILGSEMTTATSLPS